MKTLPIIWKVNQLRTPLLPMRAWKVRKIHPKHFESFCSQHYIWWYYLWLGCNKKRSCNSQSWFLIIWEDAPFCETILIKQDTCKPSMLQILWLYVLCDHYVTMLVSLLFSQNAGPLKTASGYDRMLDFFVGSWMFYLQVSCLLIIHLIVTDSLFSVTCNNHQLQHWGQDEMDKIWQKTFSNVFSWQKTFEFQLKFYWSLFLMAQLTIFQHWFR